MVVSENYGEMITTYKKVEELRDGTALFTLDHVVNYEVGDLVGVQGKEFCVGQKYPLAMKG